MKSTLKIKITFIEELLGTSSNDPDIQREFIASKSPDAQTIEDEVAAVGVDAVVDKGKTVFPRENGKPFMYDYQVKGFFKDACSSLSRVKDTKSGKMKAYKKIIDGTIFVGPRKIIINLPDGGVIGSCQRPLRASGPQGERVALANSESIPAGSSITFDLTLLDDSIEDTVIEWLDYGILRGMGQWRNSGKGRFACEIVN